MKGYPVQDTIGGEKGGGERWNMKFWGILSIFEYISNKREDSVKKSTNSPANFDEVLGAASKFPADTMEEIAELLHKRAVEMRRKDLALEIKSAQSEFKAGRAKKVSVESLLEEIGE